MRTTAGIAAKMDEAKATAEAPAAGKRSLNKVQLPTPTQLPLWPESLVTLPAIMRTLPNEILRCALFNARNRNQPREHLKEAAIAVIGNGKITYTGEELRQDDAKVWFQIVHLAKSVAPGEYVEFKPAHFCEDIQWSLNGESYKRLRESIKRMQPSSLIVQSERLSKLNATDEDSTDGISLSMIPGFAWQGLSRWKVRVSPELVKLFGESNFTRLEWERHLRLPCGLASWLHGYYSTHSDPYPIKLETIAAGAGLQTSDIIELTKTVRQAHKALKAEGFLVDFKIKKGLVSVVRAPRKLDL